MSVLSYIYHLGIVFIIFEVLWNLSLFFTRILFPASKDSPLGSVLIRAISYYFLVVLSADKTLVFLPSPDFTWSSIVLLTIGTLILYSYLAGKVQKTGFKVVINAKQVEFGKQALLPLLGGLTIISAVAFVLLVYYPEVGRNRVTLWLVSAIDGIYRTPVIGWLFGFAGIIFVITTLVKGWITTNVLLAKFSGMLSRKKVKDDDGFDDYEEIKD